MEMIRTFLAVNFSDKNKKTIIEYKNKLEKINVNVKWVEDDNIHLTLKFWGEINFDKIETVKSILPEIFQNFSIQYSIKGSGVFPNYKNPRIIWLGINDINKNLLFYFNKLEELSQKLNLKLENRPFKPHLTLGRIKSNININTLFTFLKNNPFKEIIENTNKITLYKSELTKKGPIYTPLLEITS